MDHWNRHEVAIGRIISCMKSASDDETTRAASDVIAYIKELFIAITEDNAILRGRCDRLQKLCDRQSALLMERFE